MPPSLDGLCNLAGEGAGVESLCSCAASQTCNIFHIHFEVNKTEFLKITLCIWHRALTRYTYAYLEAAFWLNVTSFAQQEGRLFAPSPTQLLTHCMVYLLSQHQQSFQLAAPRLRSANGSVGALDCVGASIRSQHLNDFGDSLHLRVSSFANLFDVEAVNLHGSIVKALHSVHCSVDGVVAKSYKAEGLQG